MTAPLLLSPAEACERLGLARSSLYGLVRAGRIRAVRPLAAAGELRFRDADLIAFVDALEAVDPAAVPAKVADDRLARLTPARRRRAPRSAA